MQRPTIPALILATTVAVAACAPVASTPASSGGGVLGILEIRAVDLRFEPKELKVDKAGRYDVLLTNDGAIPHNITFPDVRRDTRYDSSHVQPGEAAPGTSVTVAVVVPETGLLFICSLPGHVDAGMTGSISVAGSTAGQADAAEVLEVKLAK